MIQELADGKRAPHRFLPAERLPVRPDARLLRHAAHRQRLPLHRRGRALPANRAGWVRADVWPRPELLAQPARRPAAPRRFRRLPLLLPHPRADRHDPPHQLRLDIFFLLRAVGAGGRGKLPLAERPARAGQGGARGGPRRRWRAGWSPPPTATGSRSSSTTTPPPTRRGTSSWSPKTPSSERWSHEVAAALPPPRAPLRDARGPARLRLCLALDRGLYSLHAAAARADPVL